MSSDRRFAAFILTNGRPDNVITYQKLRYHGYTGRIVLVVDDLDKTLPRYQELYGDEVVVFDKRAIAATFDTGDNFDDMRAIVYARNASFGIAQELGLTHFVQLDDDYTGFMYRFDHDCSYLYGRGRRGLVMRNLDKVFDAFVNFLDDSGVDTISMAQGGDFIGGGGPGCNPLAQSITMVRKCMNSFFCRTDRPFKFIGRINEDVNTYTRTASTGLLMVTCNQVSLDQAETQSSKGGMTELYLASGTYLKSFYSVMFHPSSVVVRGMGAKNRRLHHGVAWDHTVPKILSESTRRN